MTTVLTVSKCILCLKKINHFAIFNIFYNDKSAAMKYDILIPLTTKWMLNFPPHLGYVPALPENTLTIESCGVFLSQCNVAALKRAGCADRYESVHSNCSQWLLFAFTHASSRVRNWSVASLMILCGILSQVSMRRAAASSHQCHEQVSCTQASAFNPRYDNQLDSDLAVCSLRKWRFCSSLLSIMFTNKTTIYATHHFHHCTEFAK